MSKLWEKESKVDKKIEEFTVGNDYILDEELIRYDCLGSIAHCRMLGKIGILEDKEVEKTIGILEEIIDKETLEILPNQEDCHTAIENYLTEITGFSATSLQPNSGAQGEYSGLMVIRSYLNDLGQGNRNICLIPSSAHGTNPASAVMAGFKVVVIKTDEFGNIDLEDIKNRITAKDITGSIKKKFN